MGRQKLTWYNSGTVTVTNNSATVTGAGTAWVDNVDAGQAFVGPNGIPYEILSVNSATSITLRTNYVGATAAGQAYRIMPVQGYLRDLATQAAELVLSFAAVRDGIGQGIFPVGSVGAPGFRFSGDEDTGIYRPAANALGFVTAGSERGRFDASGNFGIGTLTPGQKLDVNGGIRSYGWGSAPYGNYIFGSAGTEYIYGGGGAVMTFAIAGVDRVAITNSGLGIGTNSPRSALELSSAAPYLTWNETDQPVDGRAWRWGMASGSFYLQTVDDAFSVANTAYQVIRVGVAVNQHRWFADGVERLRLTNTGVVHPGADNAQDLGLASLRWAVVRAGTGAISTSDNRSKQDIGSIPDEWLDAWGDVNWARFKFIDAVQAKGDAARWHIGLIAQAVHDAFQMQGLDARAIGLLCFDEWDEQREIDAETGQSRVTLAAGDRWGLRYDECQAMEAAWQRRELARKDALIASLAARLEVLEAA